MYLRVVMRALHLEYRNDVYIYGSYFRIFRIVSLPDYRRVEYVY
jgi:hypothetical protein